jgi:hypothetical protein
MTRPKGYYRKRDRTGKLKTHPVFADKHHIHHEEHGKVYQLPQRSARIIGFDVDGTLNIAGGTIGLADLKRLKDEGWAVAIISDATKRKEVKDAFAHEADIFLSKPKAKSMKLLGKGFDTKVYVGNSKADEKASARAEWQYLTPSEFEKKVMK